MYHCSVFSHAEQQQAWQVAKAEQPLSLLCAALQLLVSELPWLPTTGLLTLLTMLPLQPCVHHAHFSLPAYTLTVAPQSCRPVHAAT